MAARVRRSPGALKPVTDWPLYYREIWKRPMTTTEPTDRMTLPAFLVARDAARKAAAAFERVKPDCRSCANFDMGRCQHFGDDIPKEFQETPEGCESWVFDGIPF